jgi:aminopeptidase N
LEPFFCNRWFPCFDQPSLRAPLKLSVTVPVEKWVVFGNGALKEKTAAEDGWWCHTFEPSPPISTYIYGMDAGSFSVIENDNKFKVPVRIGIRKSKIQYIDPREFFRILEAAILFYEDFFSTPFPF